jgi:hypothetical protein
VLLNLLNQLTVHTVSYYQKAFISHVNIISSRVNIPAAGVKQLGSGNLVICRGCLVLLKILTEEVSGPDSYLRRGREQEMHTAVVTKTPGKCMATKLIHLGWTTRNILILYVPCVI